MKKQPKFGMFLIYALVLVLGLLIISYFTNRPDANEVQYSEVVDLFESEQVKSFEIKDDTVTMELRAPYKGNSEVFSEIVNFSVFYSDLNDLVREQTKSGVIESYHYPPYSEPSFFMTLLPYLLLGALFLIVLSGLPMIVNAVWYAIDGVGIQDLAFSGSSLLIVVGVALETFRELEAQMTLRNYKGFLD